LSSFSNIAFGILQKEKKDLDKEGQRSNKGTMEEQQPLVAKRRHAKRASTLEEISKEEVDPSELLVGQEEEKKAQKRSTLDRKFLRRLKNVIRVCANNTRSKVLLVVILLCEFYFLLELPTNTAFS
jgi:hypothetical protein